jgi:hypothetical protein
MSVRPLPNARCLALLAALAVTGCAFHPPDVTPPPPIVLPDATSPTELMERFRLVYQQQLEPEYAALLTSDFRYRFSFDSDPLLVAQYGENWGKDAEVESATHLFDGFVSGTSGKFEPGATNISMALNAEQVFDDPAHPDSVEWYRRVVVTRVIMSIELAATPDPQVLDIDARHEFYVVRGDAAVLDPAQEPRPDRWYIRRWEDLSTPLAAVVTWGARKAVAVR